MRKYVFEFRDDEEMVTGLYDADVKIEDVCGFCKLHDCYLTVNMIRRRECLNKQCYHLLKDECHEWWEERRAIKQMRRARKEHIRSLTA